MLQYGIRILLLLTLPITLSAEKLGTLEDIYQPNNIAVYKGNLFITEQYRVHVFDLPDLKNQKKFAGKGSGPMEFNKTPKVKILDDKVLLFETFKFAFFKPTGDLISEQKVPFALYDIGAIGDKFVLCIWDWRSEQKDNTSVNSITLFNKSFEKIKSLALTDHGIKPSGTKMVRPLIYPLFKFQVYENKIYLVNCDKGFHFDIYDGNGNPMGEVHRDYRPLKISEAFKVMKLEEHKNLPPVKKRWHIMKNQFIYTFPEYFPAIKDFQIADGKIFVNTYLEKENQEEYWILSIEGKLIKKAFLPRVNEMHRYFAGEFFYYIFENDDEEWECHKIKI